MTRPTRTAPASDRLLARAVRLALRADWDADGAAADLLGLGAGPFEVHRACVRANRALEHRTSEVATRVAVTLATLRDAARQPASA